MQLIDPDAMVTFKAYEKEMVTERQMTVGELIRRYTTTGEVPTIDPVKHGHWYGFGSSSCWCSRCGCKNNMETKYCPNCGALMDAEGDE